MNLAFTALCILLLALPGVIFRKAFARASVPIWGSARGGPRQAINKYPVSIRPITEEISVSLFWTIVLHVIWLSLASVCGFAQPRYDYVVRIVHGPDNVEPGTYHAALDYLANQRLPIVVYFLSLYAFSYIAGRSWLTLVRRWQLDHRFFFTRLEDQWFYFLKGEVFDFVEFDKFLTDPRPQICGTYVSVVVTQTGRDYLYKGFLWDFHLDRHGQLDRLVLHHVIRAPFTQEPLPAKGKKKGPRIEDGDFVYQRVSSQLFTVRYADCKTLACTYFYIRRPKQPAAETLAA